MTEAVVCAAPQPSILDRSVRPHRLPLLPATTPGHLRANNLTDRARNGKALVAGISLDVAPRGRLATVGPNGAGKATLRRMLFGRLQPSSGVVELDGARLGRIPARARAQRVAVVTQDEQPDLRLTVLEHAALGRIPRHGRQDQAARRRVVERSFGWLAHWFGWLAHWFGWLAHWGGLLRDRAGRLDVSAARIACAVLSGVEALINPPTQNKAA